MYLKTILFIIPSITNYFTFLEDITYELISRGEIVYVASSRTHISELNCYDREINGTLIEIDFPRGFEWKKHMTAAKQLRKIVTEINPDVVNVHFSAAMFTTAIARTADWPATIAMVHGLAYPMLSGWKKIAIGSAERWAARKMDMLILLNKVDRMALHSHVEEEKIHVLSSFGLGCDLKRFNREAISHEADLLYHRRLGVREGDFVFIFVGRQVHFKGFDRLIKAYLMLYEDHKNIKLILVGAKDHIHSNNLTADEEKEMKQCPGVINVGWKENVNNYLIVADVNVFPSEREGMPVNLMESLAIGVPVVTTDSRGCNEVVKDGVNGFILKNNTVKEIHDTMLYLYENPDVLQRLSKGALNSRSKFDRGLFIKEILGIFDSLPSQGTD